MSLKVLNQALEIEQLVGAQSAQVLLRAEALVPGAGREAIEALMAEADLVIGNTEVQTDRVVIDGVAHCQAIYRQGEESTLRALTAQAALSHVFDLPGVAPGMAGRVNGQVEHVEAKYENGHRPLPIEHLKKLCLFYNVSCDYILCLPNLPYPKR